MKNIIGIQQVGIGIPDVQMAWEFYRKNFGMDIPVFQESAEAKLMTKYTGGVVHSRSAILAINIQGGSGLEIWQFTSRETVKPEFEITLGDLGLFVTRIKSRNVEATYEEFSRSKLNIISKLLKDPTGNFHFFLKDPFNNISTWC